jgi:hypothetical protein
MSALTIWSSVSLVIQTLTLAMLIFAYAHFKSRHDKKVHGSVTSVAYVLNMLTIFLIMIPALVNDLGDIGSNPCAIGGGCDLARHVCRSALGGAFFRA